MNRHNRTILFIRIRDRCRLLFLVYLASLILVSLTGCDPSKSTDPTADTTDEPIEIPGAPFPYSTPEDQGLSSSMLGDFFSEMSGWVISGRIVGGELLVVKNRYTGKCSKKATPVVASPFSATAGPTAPWPWLYPSPMSLSSTLPRVGARTPLETTSCPGYRIIFIPDLGDFVADEFFRLVIGMTLRS